MPFVPSSILATVVMPGATSSVLVPLHTTIDASRLRCWESRQQPACGVDRPSATTRVLYGLSVSTCFKASTCFNKEFLSQKRKLKWTFKESCHKPFTIWTTTVTDYPSGKLRRLSWESEPPWRFATRLKLRKACKFWSRTQLCYFRTTTCGISPYAKKTIRVPYGPLVVSGRIEDWSASTIVPPSSPAPTA